MNKQLQEYFNSGARKIPNDKTASSFAIGREKLFPRNSKICDLGGSTGIDSIYFLKKGHSVVLVDVSDYATEIARNNIRSLGLSKNLRVKLVDISECSLPLVNDSFDIVFSRLTLQYFTFERTVEIIKDILRVLKTGGLAFIAVKSASDKAEIIFLKKTAKEIAPGVFKDGKITKSRFTVNQWKTILSKAGVKNYKIGKVIQNFKENDAPKSGLRELHLTEISFIK